VKPSSASTCPSRTCSLIASSRLVIFAIDLSVAVAVLCQ
jgi:hypothetical protein